MKMFNRTWPNNYPIFYHHYWPLTRLGFTLWAWTFSQFSTHITDYSSNIKSLSTGILWVTVWKDLLKACRQYPLLSHHLLSQSFIAEVYKVGQLLHHYGETMLLIIVSSFSRPLFAWKWFTGLGAPPPSEGSRIRARLTYQKKTVDPQCTDYVYRFICWFQMVSIYYGSSSFCPKLHRYPKHRVKSLTNEQGKKALWVISLLCCIRVSMIHK